MPCITHQWFHQIIETRWKSANGPFPYNLPPQWGCIVGLEGKRRWWDMLALCYGCQRKDPCEEKTINNLSSIKFKAAANSRGLYIVNYMNFLLLCHTKEQLKYIHQTLLPPFWFCPLMPQWQALEILEDKSDMQTLIVSRICGQKQH